MQTHEQAVLGSPLQGMRVSDAMHPGLVTCQPGTRLTMLARMLATYRVHAIVVVSHPSDRLADDAMWAVVSDVDLARAAQAPDFEHMTARSVAATPAVTVETGDPLLGATELMVEHGVSHLIVLDPTTGRPFGVLSTLDIARVTGGVT